MKKLIFILPLLLAMCGPLPPPTPPPPTGTCQTVLTWQGPDDAAGYRIYQTMESGVYEDGPILDIPAPSTGVTIAVTHPDMTREMTWYWVVTVYDKTGNESEESNEVSCTWGGMK